MDKPLETDYCTVCNNYMHEIESRQLGRCTLCRNEKMGELAKLVKSTAKGALVASERDKNAMKKAMEAIGLLNSMVAGGEKHSDISRRIVEGAIVDLLHAMQFKADVPKNGGALGTWAGNPEMAEEFIRQQQKSSPLGKAIHNLRGGRTPPTELQSFA